MPNAPDLQAAIANRLPGATQLLEQVVNINSYSRHPTGVNAVQEIFQAAFDAIGMRTTRRTTAGCGDILTAESALGVSGGTLLVGHADTVHPPSSPFQRFSRDGDIARGPGVLDMKGGLITALLALQALHDTKQLNSCRVGFIINPDEEIGSHESAACIQRLAKTARAALVFEWGRTNNMLITRRKGVGMFELQVQGRATHSGNAHQEGRSAIHQLAHSIVRLQALTNYTEGTTVNVGLVEGGSSVNTVPERASASFDARVTSVSNRERVREAVRQIASTIDIAGTSITVHERNFSAPLEESAATTALVEELTAIGAEIGLRFTKTLTPLGGGSDANTTAAVGVPTIDGLGPLGDGAHSEAEHIQLSSIPLRATAVACFIARRSEASGSRG